MKGALLAQLIVVMIAFALLEQYFHALRHVDPQEHVGVTNDRCHDCKNYCLSDGVRRQVLLAEDLHLQVPLYDEGAVEAAEDADDEVEEDLEEVPRAVVFDLEHDELASAEGIHGL